MMMEEESHPLEHTMSALTGEMTASPSIRGNNFMAVQLPPGQSKYGQLLGVIEEMGKDLRSTYAGSKSSAERFKRGIVHARILVRECLIETERSARQ